MFRRYRQPKCSTNLAMCKRFWHLWNAIDKIIKVIRIDTKQILQRLSVLCYDWGLRETFPATVNGLQGGEAEPVKEGGGAGCCLPSLHKRWKSSLGFPVELEPVIRPHFHVSTTPLPVTCIIGPPWESKAAPNS